MQKIKMKQFQLIFTCTFLIIKLETWHESIFNKFFSISCYHSQLTSLKNRIMNLNLYKLNLQINEILHRNNFSKDKNDIITGSACKDKRRNYSNQFIDTN